MCGEALTASTTDPLSGSHFEMHKIHWITKQAKYIEIQFYPQTPWGVPRLRRPARISFQHEIIWFYDLWVWIVLLCQEVAEYTLSGLSRNDFKGKMYSPNLTIPSSLGTINSTGGLCHSLFFFSMVFVLLCLCFYVYNVSFVRLQHTLRDQFAPHHPGRSSSPSKLSLGSCTWRWCF